MTPRPVEIDCGDPGLDPRPRRFRPDPCPACAGEGGRLVRRKDVVPWRDRLKWVPCRACNGEGTRAEGGAS